MEKLSELSGGFMYELTRVTWSMKQVILSSGVYRFRKEREFHSKKLIEIKALKA